MTEDGQELLLRYQDNKVLQFRLSSRSYGIELDDIFTEIWWMLKMPDDPRILKFLVEAQDVRIRSKLTRIIFKGTT